MVNQTYYGPPAPPPPKPYTRVPPTPPSAASVPVAVRALVMIRQVADHYRDWTPPGTDGDHTASLSAWLRVCDDLRALRDLLAQLDPPEKGGSR